MKIAFFVLSLLSLFSLGSAFKGCESKQLNELCQSKVIDNCYTCVKVMNDYGYPHPPVCVPVFHHSYGILDNYPRDKWNCTLYRPTLPEPQIPDKDDEDEEDFKEDIVEEVNDEVSSAVIDELENEANVVEGICQIDEFIYEMCDKRDNIGFCLIASYIHDMCNINTSKSKEVSLQAIRYESPWGPLSDCNQYFYKEICTNKVAKFCFDCRKFLGKELFTQRPRYSYYCSPFYKDMNEKESTDWFTKEKYECKRWYNPNFAPSSISTENFETERKLYSACTGPICRKEGWFYRGDHFGKEWCGMGKCKEYFDNRVLCDFPTNCGKKSNQLLSQNNESNEHNEEREFQTMGCGSEKFKCMLKKSCRNLVKSLDKCDDDLVCIYNIIVSEDTSNNETFQNLVKCMFPH